MGGPESNTTCANIKRGKFGHTHIERTPWKTWTPRRSANVKTEAEIGVRVHQAKQCLGPLSGHWSERRRLDFER